MRFGRFRMFRMFGKFNLLDNISTLGIGWGVK